MTRRQVLLILVLLGVVLALPVVLAQSPFHLELVTLALILAFAACGWNLMGGYQDQLALGHAAYFAIGAYTSSLLFVRLSVNVWLGMAAGFLLAAVAAGLVAALCFRLKGAFYALASVALAEVVRVSLITQGDLTGGGAGLSIPYEPGLANFIFEGRAAYIRVFGVAVIALVALTMVAERSRWGVRSLALSADEDAARALGVRVFRTKVVTAGLSGGLTAVAGTFYAQYLLYLSPDRVAGLDLSIEIPLIAVLGGAARAWGPLLGAAILVPTTGILRAELADSGFGTQAPAVTGMLYGLLLVVLLLAAPEGIADLSRRLRHRVQRHLNRARTHAVP